MSGAIRQYLDHVAVERGLAQNTVQAYRRDLERYGEWCQGQGLEDLDEVTAEDLSAFAAWLNSGLGLAASSAARIVVSVRGFHRFAAIEGLARSDPGVDLAPPAIPSRLPKALTYPDVARLIDAAGLDQSPEGLRNVALLEVLYGTGCRISEAVGLDVDDLDLAHRVCRVVGKGSKERRLPLGEYAAAGLDAYLVRSRPDLARRGRGSPRVFLNSLGRPLSRQSAWQVIQEARQRAGVAATVSPHTLRHSFATHLLQGGADIRVVQELLGHASVTTTQIYTKVTVDTLREVYATSHPRAR